MNDRGIALILVLMVMMTLSALAMSLALMVSSESRVTANYRDGMEVLYGADAVLERVLPDLAREPDFDRTLADVRVSSFIDGPPGLRRMPDGTFADLHALTAMLNCGSPICREPDPGETDPRWQLYGYGPSTALGAGRLGSRVYTVVWISPSTGLGAGGVENPASGRLSITAHAYGPSGTRRVIEATVAKTGTALSVLSWREIR